MDRLHTPPHSIEAEQAVLGGLMLAPPLLEVTDLRKHYHAPRRWLGSQSPPVRAVDGVSFQVARGETLALVGESGCGKTTTAKSVMRLIEPTSGSVRLEGRELVGLARQAMRQHRRDLQIIFQDPYASLNPRLTAGEIVAEPLRNFGGASAGERRERVQWLFQRVGLRPEGTRRYVRRVIEVPDDHLVERLTGRRTCRGCGYMHHIEFDPPKQKDVCDKCTGELYLRDDDKEATIRDRLSTYHAQTSPLIDYYSKKGIVRKIDGTRSMEDVQKSITKSIGA